MTDLGGVDLDASARIVAREYRGANYVLANRTPFASDLDPQDSILVYVSAPHIQEFLSVDPQIRSGGAEPSPGMSIVREVWRDGSPQKLTVMIKDGPGYYPQGGDFYYAVLSMDGTQFLPDNTGVPQHGAMNECGTCHAERGASHFLFGVPHSAR